MDELNPSIDVRTSVREHYAALASTPTGRSSCCGPDCGCGSADHTLESTLYSLEELEILPAEVRNLSLGCGNPIAIASLSPGQVVVDLGSGGGIDCFLAAQRVGPEGYVIGIDMTPAMLDVARRNRLDLGLENVEFRLGEIEHLPLADESADVVISNCVINLSPDKLQVLKEAYRVLRPGGRLAVSDIVASQPITDDLRRDLEAWAGCVSGAVETDEFKSLLILAGFADVEIREVETEGESRTEGSRPAAVYQAYVSARKR